MADYRVTVVFDYSSDVEVDEDELHDALMENFDTVDLEFQFEAAKFAEDGTEIPGETETVNVNCDTVREIEVVKLAEE